MKSGRNWLGVKKINWSEKERVINEQFIERYSENTLLSPWYIWRRDDESERVERWFDDLRNRRKYWELKEEAEDRKRWEREFKNVR